MNVRKQDSRKMKAVLGAAGILLLCWIWGCAVPSGGDDLSPSGDTLESIYEPNPPETATLVENYSIVQESSSASLRGQLPWETLQPAKEIRDVWLYLWDMNSPYLREKAQQVEDTPQGLIDALIEGSSIPEGTKILSFQVLESSQERSATVNVSGEFLEGLSTVGSRQQDLILGSLANTLIRNYDLDSLELTCTGESVSTGRLNLEDPLVFMEDLLDPNEENWLPESLISAALPQEEAP